MPTNKKIVLHPLDRKGNPDKSVRLFPKSYASGLVKEDGITPFVAQEELSEVNAGTNITITTGADGKKKINATPSGGGSYTSGNGINILNREISVNTDVIASVERVNQSVATETARAINEENSIRALANGKCKVYTLSYNETYNSSWASSGRYKNKNGNVLSQAQCEELISGKTLKNSIFNSNDNRIETPSSSSDYLILEDFLDIGNHLILVVASDLYSLFKTGDEVFVVETDVPDRWYSSGYLLALETKHYTAGTGINITNNAISVNTNVIATQNDLQNVREVAEGKCKTYVISYNTTAPTTDLGAQSLKKFDGTYFTSLSDFNNYVSLTWEEETTPGVCKNGDFNSNFDNIGFVASFCYIITSDNFVIKLADINFKKGDEVLVSEINVPDRWYSGNGFFNILETKQINLSAYQTLLSALNKLNIDFIDETLSLTKMLMPRLPTNIGDGVYTPFAIKENGVVRYVWQVPTYDGGNE